MYQVGEIEFFAIWVLYSVPHAVNWTYGSEDINSPGLSPLAEAIVNLRRPTGILVETDRTSWSSAIGI